MALEQARMDLEAAHERGVLDERDRIAREMHDSVMRTLFGVGLNLQALIAEAASERMEARLAQAIDDLDQAIRDLRDHIYRS